MFKKITSLLLVCCMAFAFVACGNKTKGTANGAESLVIPITRDENTLTPFTYVSGSPGLDVTRLVFDSLYTRDKDNNVIPWMATSCDHDQEYKTFTVKINQGMKWHDGKDVTLEDVKFTFEYVLTQQSTRWKKIGAKVLGLEIKDDALIIKTKNSEPNFVSECLTDLPIVPKHVYENQADAKQVKQTVGSGMYKLTEYVQGQKYVLTATDNYFKGNVKVKQINMPIITDTSSIYQGIKTGEYATFTGSLTPELVETFEGDKKLTVKSGPGFASSMLYMNTEVEPFNNVEFRQAVALALNSQEIVDRVFLGKADLGTAGYYSPASPFAKGNLNFEFNLDKANQKLDALGYDKKNAEGIRLDKNGKELSFELYTATSALRLRAAEVIAEQLKRAGIRVEVKSFEQDTLDTYVWPDFDITKKRNYQMAVWGWSAPGQTQENILLANCSDDPIIGTYNLSGYKDDQFKALEEKYLNTLDEKQRLDLVYQMQEHIAKTVPFYTYAYQNIITVHNNTQYDGFVLQNGVGIINVFSFLDAK